MCHVLNCLYKLTCIVLLYELLYIMLCGMDYIICHVLCCLTPCHIICYCPNCCSMLCWCMACCMWHVLMYSLYFCVRYRHRKSTPGGVVKLSLMEWIVRLFCWDFWLLNQFSLVGSLNKIDSFIIALNKPIKSGYFWTEDGLCKRTWLHERNSTRKQGSVRVHI